MGVYAYPLLPISWNHPLVYYSSYIIFLKLNYREREREMGSFENSYIPENPRTPPISYISQTVIPFKKPISEPSKTYLKQKLKTCTCEEKKFVHMQRPMDKITSVAIPFALAGSSLFLIGRGIYNMSRGIGKKESTRCKIKTGNDLGGVAHQIKAQFNPSKNPCSLISTAPVTDPNCSPGSFLNNLLTKSLPSKLTPGQSGNLTPSQTTFAKVSSSVVPLKGVLPYKSSYNKTPKVHQSTGLPCPSPFMISGAKYSWVPTNEFDRALRGSTISCGVAGVSVTVGSGFGFGVKHGTCHGGWRQKRWSMQLECLFLGDSIGVEGGGVMTVGFGSHFRDKSKSMLTTTYSFEDYIVGNAFNYICAYNEYEEEELNISFSFD
ncbi:hypothetical protein LXL04_013146 [Taraxacum kok-saghyz]